MKIVKGIAVVVVLFALAGFAGYQGGLQSDRLSFTSVGGATPDVQLRRTGDGSSAALQLLFGTTLVAEYTFNPDTIVLEGATDDAFEPQNVQDAFTHFARATLLGALDSCYFAPPF